MSEMSSASDAYDSDGSSNSLPTPESIKSQREKVQNYVGTIISQTANTQKRNSHKNISEARKNSVENRKLTIVGLKEDKSDDSSESSSEDSSSDSSSSAKEETPKTIITKIPSNQSSTPKSPTATPPTPPSLSSSSSGKAPMQKNPSSSNTNIPIKQVSQQNLNGKSSKSSSESDSTSDASSDSQDEKSSKRITSALSYVTSQSSVSKIEETPKQTVNGKLTVKTTTSAPNSRPSSAHNSRPPSAQNSRPVTPNSSTASRISNTPNALPKEWTQRASSESGSSSESSSESESDSSDVPSPKISKKIQQPSDSSSLKISPRNIPPNQTSVGNKGEIASQFKSTSVSSVQPKSLQKQKQPMMHESPPEEKKDISSGSETSSSSSDSETEEEPPAKTTTRSKLIENKKILVSKEAMTQTSPKTEKTVEESQKKEVPSLEAPSIDSKMEITKPTELLMNHSETKVNEIQKPITYTTTNGSEANEATDDGGGQRDSAIQDNSKLEMKLDVVSAKEEVLKQSHQSVELPKPLDNDALLNRTNKRKSQTNKNGCCTIL